ncbi:MAG: ATP synthase subunit I [Desulfatiglandales bacterium]
MQKKLCSQALLAAIAGALILILFGEKAVGKGLVLGTLFSAINFVLMGQFLHHTMSNSRTRASVAAFGSILFRFALLAVPLIVSIRLDSIHIIGVVIGIFMVQLIILFNHLVRIRTSSVQKS